MKNVQLLVTALILLIVLPACHRARRTPLCRIENRQECKKHNGFEVAVKALTGAESEEFFGADLVAKGYQPLQVEMCNDGKDVYAISGNYIELPLAPGHTVSKELHYGTFNFAWTTSLLSAIYCFPLLPVIVYSAYNMHDYNKAIDTKVRDISLNSDELIHINPGELVTKIVFINGARSMRRCTLGFLNVRTQEVIKMNFNL